MQRIGIGPRSPVRGQSILCETWSAQEAVPQVTGSYRLMPWPARFEEPIPLPNGRELVTLKDAGAYITRLPKTEHDAQEWQTAMEALILVAENGGPTILARIGVMRALNRHVERVFDTSCKEHHWGKRKIARDQ